MENTPPPVFTHFDIRSILKAAVHSLNTVSDSATLDAELLLAHCLNKSRTYLHTWPETELSSRQLACFQSLIEKRLTDYPVAYLLGHQPFWTLDLTVTPEVLIPRPETELLVETALEKISEITQPKILDLGTGTGAIALAIASERPDAIIFASDFFAAVLEIANKNAVKHNLSKSLTFLQSDWFLNITERAFDLIVSNPPYIEGRDVHLSGSIRHEPRQALVSENHGMKDLEKIINNSPDYLTANGWLILEHGYNQEQACQELLQKNHFYNITTKKDLNNIERVSLAQCNNRKES